MMWGSVDIESVYIDGHGWVLVNRLPETLYCDRISVDCDFRHAQYDAINEPKEIIETHGG